MKPILIFFEISRPFLKRPFNFKSKYMRRVGWGWFAVAIVRMELKEYGDKIRRGELNWMDR